MGVPEHPGLGFVPFAKPGRDELLREVRSLRSLSRHSSLRTSDSAFQILPQVSLPLDKGASLAHSSRACIESLN